MKANKVKLIETGRNELFTKITYIKIPILYVEAKGKLDIYNAVEYLNEIVDQINKTSPKELVLEFSEITSVASIGLRALLELYRTMQKKNGRLKLKNVNNDILEVFKIAGFDNFLIIENESDKA